MRKEDLMRNDEGDSDEDGATRALSQQLTLVVFDTAEPGKKEELGQLLETLIAPTWA